MRRRMLAGACLALAMAAGVATVGSASTDARTPSRARTGHDGLASLREAVAAAAYPRIDSAPQATATGPGVRKDATLAWPLVQLADAAAGAAAIDAAIRGADSPLLPKTLRDLGATGLLRMDGDRVQVYVQATDDIDSTASDLSALGAHVERLYREGGLLQAWLPIGVIDAAAALPGVDGIRLPDYPDPMAGAVTSEGDAIHNADDVRAMFGADGTGVRVGVISDGVEGLGTSQASGDLPAVNTATCDVGPGSPTGAGAGSEGTAMLEIVHDLAPGAELWFGFTGNGFGGGTSLEFMAAVDCLADNVDVIVDDLAFVNAGPYDGTSAVSMNTSDALNEGGNRARGYYNAVGNYAQKHYEEPYVYSGFTYVDPDFGDEWDFQLFTGTFNTAEADLSLACQCTDTVLLNPGGSLRVFVQWDDPWGASANDYDLLVFNGLALVAAGWNVQDGSEDPTESAAYENETMDVQLIDIAIGNYFGAAAPRTFDMFVLCSGCQKLSNDARHNLNTPCSSVANNSDAGGGVVSLAAIAADDPGWDDYEVFSTCGPTNDGRLKPDAAAIDGVVVTGNGGFGSPFYGTSAAAPHAGAIAALILECNPSLTRTQLRNALLDNAVDLSFPGPDYDFGYGRLDALASANAVGCAGPEPTATATSTATPTTPPVATSTQAPSATPTNTAPPPPTATATLAIFYGDADCNGIINAIDVAILLQFGAGLLPALPCPQNADVNQDGIITVIDATLILQYTAGFLPHLPP